MKNLLYLFLVVGASIFMPHQGFTQKRKVKESSEKKQPDWVNSLVKDFIIVTASSPTLEDAQQKSLAKVKENIISSVAENIQTSSEYFRSENIINNNSQFSESLQTTTKTRAANIDFIKGISLSKVAAFYWEHVEEGTDLKYYYHIKYPFSQAELKMLIMEFEKADRLLTEQLDGLLAKIDELTNMEEMGQTVKELEALALSFFETDSRRNKANVGIAKLKEMLKNFSIETVNNTLGEVRMSLKIGEKRINTSKKPKVRSNCAKITDVRSNGDEWVVTYEYGECYEDPSNSIIVEFLTSYGKATSTFFFNISSEKIDVFVNDAINMTGGVDNGTEISGVKCHISLTAKYATPFVVEKVILNFGSEAPIIVEGLNIEFSGVGKHDLNFTIDQNILKETYNSKKYAMIKGSVHYKSVKSGERLIYKMYNQDVTTSW